MAAFNWVELENQCPCCRSSGIIAQTHIASSYDGDSDRFFDHIYKIGHKMLWWPETDPRWHSWYESAHIAYPVKRIAIEYCDAHCSNQHCKLFAAIEFTNLVPMRVLALGLASDRPEEYL